MAKAQHALRYRLLPRLLREMRNQAGLTQRALAARLAVTHIFIHKSETGERRVDVTEFMDWCKACDIDPITAFTKLAKSR